MARSKRSEVPAAADRTAVGLALAFDPGEHGRVERVALGAIPALAGTHPLLHFEGRFFHAVRTRLAWCYRAGEFLYHRPLMSGFLAGRVVSTSRIEPRLIQRMSNQRQALDALPLNGPLLSGDGYYAVVWRGGRGRFVSREFGPTARVRRSGTRGRCLVCRGVDEPAFCPTRLSKNIINHCLSTYKNIVLGHLLLPEVFSF